MECHVRVSVSLLTCWTDFCLNDWDSWMRNQHKNLQKTPSAKWNKNPSFLFTNSWGRFTYSADLTIVGGLGIVANFSFLGEFGKVCRNGKKSSLPCLRIFFWKKPEWWMFTSHKHGLFQAFFWVDVSFSRTYPNIFGLYHIPWWESPFEATTIS